MPEGTFGPAGPGNTQAPPFAVSGPTQVSVGPNRSATGSFTVSNLAGRVVRARFFVTPTGGASAGWFAVTGESERSMEVAGTATVEVVLTIPADAPAGSHSFTLAAALEEAPDRVVSSPTVTFDVPPAATKKFPWWIVIVAVGAILALAIGGVAIWWFTRAPAAPKSLTPPRVQGIPEVGGQLTVVPGTWDQAAEQLEVFHTWQVCEREEPAQGQDADCFDVTVDDAGTPQLLKADAYMVGDFADKRIRAVATAIRLPKNAEELGQLDLAKLPFTRVASAMTDVVKNKPVPEVEVPNLIGKTYSAGAAILQGLGLNAIHQLSGTVGTSCSPPVTAQNPGPGFEIKATDKPVELTTDATPLKCIIRIDIPKQYEQIQLDRLDRIIIDAEIEQAQP